LNHNNEKKKTEIEWKKFDKKLLHLDCKVHHHLGQCSEVGHQSRIQQRVNHAYACANLLHYMGKKKKPKLTLKNEDVLTIISIILRVRDTYTKKEK